MKKPVLSFLLASVAMIIAAMAIGYLFDFLIPALSVEYNNPALYRPWDDPLMYVFFIQPFMIVAMMIWIWKRVKSLFSGKPSKIALNITLIFLFASIIPGMIMTYSSFPVSFLAIVTWMVTSFVEYWVAIFIVVRMNE